MQGMRGMHTVWTRYGKGMDPSLKSFAIKYGGMPYRGGGGVDEKRGSNRTNPPSTNAPRKIFDPLFPRCLAHIVPSVPLPLGPSPCAQNHPASLSFCLRSCANADQNPLKSLDNPYSAPTLVKSTNLLDFCTCIHRFSGRNVTSTDEPSRASGVGRRNGWWNEKPMRIGKSPPAQPEGET